jgi:hypothetical protein
MIVMDIAPFWVILHATVMEPIKEKAEDWTSYDRFSIFC